MADRFQHLQTYLGAWDEPGKILSALADDFELHDPHEPKVITKTTIGDWMHRWAQRMQASGGSGEVENSDEVEVDRNGELTYWTWWRFTGTDVEGAALIKVSDDGVRYQKVAFHKAPPN